MKERTEGSKVAPREGSGLPGGSRRWPEPHARTPRLSSAYWLKEEDGHAPVGWPTVLGRPGGFGGRQVSWPRLVSLFYLLFLFSIILQLCGFIKNTKSIPKIMQLLLTTVGNISYSKHFSLGLYEHLNYFIAFKCPNANTI